MRQQKLSDDLYNLVMSPLRTLVAHVTLLNNDSMMDLIKTTHLPIEFRDIYARKIKDPMNAVRLIHYQPEAARESLIEIILQNPEACVQAGEYWHMPTFHQYGDRLVERIQFDTKASTEALITWNKDKLHGHMSQLLSAVSTDPELSYQVIEEKSHGLLQPDLQKLVEGVAQDQKLATILYKTWDYEEIRRFGEPLVRSLAATDFRDLSDKRAIIEVYRQPVVTNSYFACDSSTAQDWIKIASYASQKYFAKLSVDEFSKVSPVYRIAVNSGRQNLFYDSLDQVMEDGTVSEWCEHILDNYEKKQEGIGGDTYRGVAV
jgi:hypothetical protein